MRAVILVFLLNLPVYHEDTTDLRKPAQLEDIATAIEIAGNGDKKVIALLASIGYVETGYSLRIHDGHCQTWECDHGRARGPWQVWRNKLNPRMWAKMRGLDNTQSQAAMAALRIRIGLAQCNGSARGAIARYVGKDCDARDPLLDARFKWYQKALRAIRNTE